jgi:response regulator RpfG family c-di-GMP phosphodiesterase
MGGRTTVRAGAKPELEHSDAYSDYLGDIIVAQEIPLNTTGTAVATEQMSRILIVDDEPAILHLIKNTLNPGYICEDVLSGEHAQELLDGDGPYDVVICDVRLGGMSGIDLLKYIRRRHPGTSTILMSSLQEMDIVVAALRERADDYLIKPFDLAELYESVQRVMEMRLHPMKSEGEVREHGWNAAARALAMALGTRDNETNGHATRVVYFSLRLGKEMGLSREEMISLKLGSRLHDIGKIGVDDAILRKPGKLNAGEREKMKVHPLIGQTLVRNLDLPEGAARVVGQHHEKWDGTGYPLGLAGEDIDITSRIFSVVDAFDAIISDRVYRAGRPYCEAAIEIRDHAGTQFDPNVVEAFLRIPEEDWEHLKKGCQTDDHRPATL